MAVTALNRNRGWYCGCIHVSSRLIVRWLKALVPFKQRQTANKFSHQPATQHFHFFYLDFFLLLLWLKLASFDYHSSTQHKRVIAKSLTRSFQSLFSLSVVAESVCLHVLSRCAAQRPCRWSLPLMWTVVSSTRYCGAVPLNKPGWIFEIHWFCDMRAVMCLKKSTENTWLALKRQRHWAILAAHCK